MKHTEVYDEIIQISQKKDMNEAIDIHSQEVEETIGRETVTSVKSKNAKLWDWAKKVFGDTGRYFLEGCLCPCPFQSGRGVYSITLGLRDNRQGNSHVSQIKECKTLGLGQESIW